MSTPFHFPAPRGIFFAPPADPPVDVAAPAPSLVAPVAPVWSPWPAPDAHAVVRSLAWPPPSVHTAAWAPPLPGTCVVAETATSRPHRRVVRFGLLAAACAAAATLVAFFV